MQTKTITSNNIPEILKNIKTIIFDFDGTLISTEKYHLIAHNMVLSEILGKKIQMTKDDFSKYMGRKDTEIFKEYKTDFGVEFDEEEMITKKVNYAKELLFNENVKVFEYFETLKSIKNDRNFLIVSNQDIRLLESVLENKGISKYFDQIFCLSKMQIEKEYFYKNIYKYIDTSSKQDNKNQDIDKNFKKTSSEENQKFNENIAVFEDSRAVLTLASSLKMTTFGIESELNRNKLNGSCDYLLKYE